MKKPVLFLFMLLILVTPRIFAQDDEVIPRGEKVEALRISIYTYVLQLTPDEAKVFWPVFNKYEVELQNIKKETKRQRFEYMQNLSTMSDKEIEAAVYKLLDLEEQQTQLKKKYVEEFKKVIPMRKIILLPKAELEFKKALLNKLREQRNGH